MWTVHAMGRYRNYGESSVASTKLTIIVLGIGFVVTILIAICKKCISAANDTSNDNGNYISCILLKSSMTSAEWGNFLFIFCRDASNATDRGGERERRESRGSAQ